MDDSDSILAQAAEWRRSGRGVAIATVIATWGSSPRPVGAKLAVDEDGRIAGSVSGGCVEGAVVETAMRIIGEGTPCVLEFGVADDQAWSAGLACGGQIRIYVERIPDTPWDIERLTAAPSSGRAAVSVTRLSDGARAFPDFPERPGQLVIDDADLDKIRDTIRKDRSALIESRSGELFVDVRNTPPRLFLIGAVHIAQTLVPLAKLAGWDVTVIDPRTSFASPERFPGIALSNDWPDDALASLTLDRRSAVVTLTHDPKLDDPALQAALKSDAFYVGALGSRRTHDARCRRLREAGFGEATVARIHGPVGLAIGAISPAEIAISILSEIVGVLRGGRVAQRG